MKIDRSKIKWSPNEVCPAGKWTTQQIMESTNLKLIEFLKSDFLSDCVTFRKSNLCQWVDVLDRLDEVLSLATKKKDGRRWLMSCDVSDDDENGVELKHCTVQVLRFTRLLIENTYSRTVYNSLERLSELLYTSDLTLLVETLNLLNVFSKRTNLLTSLPVDERQVLFKGLYALAGSWGGKEAGFGLAACALDQSLEKYPPTATTVHTEFYRGEGSAAQNRPESWTMLNLENVHRMAKSPSIILDECIKFYNVPLDEQLSLLTHLRLACNFPVWTERVKLIKARLLALSTLVYANGMQENIHQLFYRGLVEELGDVLQLDQDYCCADIKATVLNTLSSIVLSDKVRNHNVPLSTVIEATGAGSYHGVLPTMVRNCINSLIISATSEPGPSQPTRSLATSLFSFLYSLATSNELGEEALVNCGMLESLLKLVNWETSDIEYIPFVTRAVRIIDYLTNVDNMQAFQSQNGLSSFINRLQIEVAACRADQPFEITPEISSVRTTEPVAVANPEVDGDGSSDEDDTVEVPMDTDSDSDLAGFGMEPSAPISPAKGETNAVKSGSASSFVENGTRCVTQRAALIKSMLNMLRRVIQDAGFGSDVIRHLMEGSLPSSLKHVISNSEYYGASLFLLSIEVVTAYVFQEPALLHSVQDNGLADVITEALLVKNVPRHRKVISTMPNVFSALCLNIRGLNAFVKCNPFGSLFKVLLSPEYVPALWPGRTGQPCLDAALNLGNGMDKFMRDQPSLKAPVTSEILQLLNNLGNLGTDTANTCVKPDAKQRASSRGSDARIEYSDGGTSDEEEDDDEKIPGASAPLSPDTQRFLAFAETHRTVLNHILRQSPQQHLADGPFSVLVDHTRVLDFDVKRKYFRAELKRLDEEEGIGRDDLGVHVRRSHVFEDSFRQLQRHAAEDWKSRFYIVFEGEEGQDAGGLLREWYVIISREIFNPMYALFTTSPGDRVTYMINSSSHVNPSHLLYFRFVGQVIAKAIYDNKLLECYFTRFLYKLIIGKDPSVTDLAFLDDSLFQRVLHLMTHPLSDFGGNLTYCLEVEELGVNEVRDLVPDGRNVPVTEENKMEYIRLVCQMKMKGAIRQQLNAFLEGFYDIIPKKLISIFNEQELELLISGLPNIDIDDLKSNTEYLNYTPNALQIEWFWVALCSFDQAEKAKFLQFVTGTSKVPLQGFGALDGMDGFQKFQLNFVDGSTVVPIPHIGLNQLDLPNYETFDKLCENLRQAVSGEAEQFPKCLSICTTIRSIFGGKNTGGKWDHFQVLVNIEFTENEYYRIAYVVEKLHNHLKDYLVCTTLPRGSPAPKGPFVHVRKGDGNSSFVGRIGTGEQELILDREGGWNHWTALHEFLHALGLHHEQSRPDREDFVIINEKNIIDGEKYNFDIEEEYETFDVPYHLKCIMHYGAYYFSKNFLPTITKKNKSPRGVGGERLHTHDIMKASRMYGAPY